MKFIKNLKIREKLSLLFLVLLVPLLLFVINSIVSEINERNNLLEAKNNLEESGLVTNLIHEFQKERGLTSGFITTEGAIYGSRMQTQRIATNDAIASLVDFLTQNKRTINEINLLSNIHQYRNSIDNLTVDNSDWDSFYYSIRDALLKQLEKNAYNIDHRIVRRNLNAHASLAGAKQYLGQLRTITTRFILNGTFTYQEYNYFGSLFTLYQLNLTEFTSSTPGEVYTIYRQTVEDGNFLEVTNLLRQLDQDPELDLTGYAHLEWFDKFTAVLEDLRTIEIASSDYLEAYMNELIKNKNYNLIIYLAFVIVAISIAFSLAIYIIRFINHSVYVLKHASDQLSLGITEVEAPIYTQDEFGELADSFRKMAEKNDDLSIVAEAVGKGIYDVIVDVKGPQDILGNAINKMKDSLKDLSKENEIRNWLLYGISRLNDLMSGSNNIQTTSKKAIDHLCQYMNCDLGVIFINNKNSQFNFIAGYGTEESSFEPKSFAIGEGVVGEAVVQHQVMIINEIPGQNLKVNTGLSESEPYNILICPFFFNDQPIGLIELASRNPFTKHEINFLEESAERLAVTLNTINTNLKTQELLHETQNQAEELETQQEELRQMNDELKRQKDQLQVSEEELKVSQEELQEKNRELGERAIELEDQYKKIQIKNQELEEARQAIELKVIQVESISRYKTEFLANMSHELRTPLNSILILSKLLIDEVEKQGLPKQAEHAKVIHTSGNDLLKLINDILDLSKIESGYIKLEVKEIPINSLDLRPDFKQIAKEKKIDFNLVIEPETPELLISDEFRLRQILKNLLSNAFKFTDNKGSVELRISKFVGERRFKSTELTEAESIIAFSVKDSGIGIPKDKHELIFEAFQQADSSTTRKFGGTGLGLSISRELAILLGGEIHLKSEMNKGSVFTLFLPQKIKETRSAYKSAFNIFVPEIEKSAKPHPIVLEPQNDGKRKTVLVIDDDIGFNTIVSDFAKSKNFDVDQAFTGSEALEKLKKKPDAVLLDVHLPDMDGLDILKMIKEDKKLKNTQVHLMTAYDDKLIDRDVDFEGYLPKPVTLEQIGKAFTNISRVPIRKVLIVEDNKIENHAISELLLSEKIESIPTFSGSEALKTLARNAMEIDAVILDLLLPDMKGFEVMEKIRSNKATSDLPIIVYSGMDLKEQEEKKLKKYANTIIIKNEYSYIRLMDEVKLFLTKMSDKLMATNDKKLDLHIPEKVLEGKKVLIADDDVRNIYSLYNALEHAGMEIFVANDGKEALQRLNESKDIDIVLMDIMMPEMDGMECTRRIRRMDEFKDLPIIALTAKAMKGDKEKCLEAGASDYVSKPVNTDKLISLMRVWVYDRKIKK